jgi:molybdate transport system substrate-binding protein
MGTEWKKVALGDPALVESGRVAERAMKKHDLADDDHQKMLIKAGTEAMALHVVERDQADAVFVYQSDLLDFALRGFEVYHIDSQDAPPVFYQAALGRLAKNPDLARSFIAFCSSESARAIWARYGFEMN